MIVSKYISERTIELYEQKQVPWGPVGEITYLRTYARPEDRGSWARTIARVTNGVYNLMADYCFEHKRPWDDVQALRSAQTMFDLMFNMKFLPPGRGLWAMGTNITTGAAYNNCGFVSTANGVPDAACWLMDMSMLGVGVGFDTLGAGKRVLHQAVAKAFKVPDSREGWVMAVGSALVGNKSFDYSQVRPAGSPINGFGGTASGPQPLIDLIEWIKANVHTAEHWTSTLIVDLMNMIGRTVVAGNVRRSAEIALGDIHDTNFLELKDYDKHPEAVRSHRWASNNSVVATPGDDYAHIVQRIAANGEPGIFWLSNARAYRRMGRTPDHADTEAVGTNPCAEQTLHDRELCCLVEMFPSRHDSYYEFQRTQKYAYLYAKAITLALTHDRTTNKIIAKNRRIGCSMSGIQEAVAKFGHHEFYIKWCRGAYKYLKSLDDRYSEWLGVNRSIKITSIKPSGTVSKLPGVTSGMHWAPAPYYWQVMRFQSDSEYVTQLRAAGHPCYDLHPNEPNTTAVYFPCATRPGVKSESEVSIWEQYLCARNLQHYYADNQVSCTIKFKPSEVDQVLPVILDAENNLKSISFLPSTDHNYEHAPWQPITKEQYEAAIASIRPVRFTDGAHEVTDSFCDGAACEVPTR